MKNMLFSFALLSSTAMASDCEKLLLEKVTKNSNIRMVKTIDTYSCGKTACAMTFEHDSSPYPNVKVLSFLDTKSKMQVLWAPEFGNTYNGKETFQKKRQTYVNVLKAANDSLTVAASVENPRDAIFWPPHRVFHTETFTCTK
jgi:hypothetical protein